MPDNSKVIPFERNTSDIYKFLDKVVLLKIETETGSFQMFSAYIIGFHLHQILDDWQCVIYTIDGTTVLNGIKSDISVLQKQLQQIMESE